MLIPNLPETETFSNDDLFVIETQNGTKKITKKNVNKDVDDELNNIKDELDNKIDTDNVYVKNGAFIFN